MARALIVVAFLAALGGAVAYFVAAWSSVGGAHISAIGWLAIVGCAIAMLAVGGGLMALVFYSARQGYDDIDRRD